MSDYFGEMGTALYNRLVGGTALIAELGGSAVYSQHPPDGAARPYIVFGYAGGGAENLNGNDIRGGLWLVQGFADTQAQARALDSLVDALLRGQNLALSAFSNFWAAREEDVFANELKPDNSRVYRAGAYYRYRVTA